MMCIKFHLECTTEREETTLYDGREWRTYYWVIRKDIMADESPYEWLWDERAFGLHEIKVIAYDKEDYTAEDEINVIVFNIGG